MKYCLKCGYQVQISDKSCMNCGSIINDQDTSSSKNTKSNLKYFSKASHPSLSKGNTNHEITSVSDKLNSISYLIWYLTIATSFILAILVIISIVEEQTNVYLLIGVGFGNLITGYVTKYIIKGFSLIVRNSEMSINEHYKEN